MAKSKRVMRRLILSKLYDSLQEQSSIVYSRDSFINGELSLHQLDAMLAFKSDPQLEELRHALDRLENGTFGICLSCKGVISQEVLDLDPAQRVCVVCERKFVHVHATRYEHRHLTT